MAHGLKVGFPPSLACAHLPTPLHRRPPSRASSGKSSLSRWGSFKKQTDGHEDPGKDPSAFTSAPTTPATQAPVSSVKLAADTSGVQSTVKRQSPPAVTQLPDSPAGEVRLLVNSDTDSNRPGGESCSPKQQQMPHVPSTTSLLLADATTQAAIAAAELARTEAEAAHPHTHHRSSMLRFMRARDDTSNQGDPLMPPLPPAAAANNAADIKPVPRRLATMRHAVAAQKAADAAVAAETPASAAAPTATGLLNKDPAAAASSTAAAGLAALVRSEPRSSNGGGGAAGMAQVVQELLASQGKTLPSSKAPTTDAGDTGVKGEGGVKKQSWLEREAGKGNSWYHR